MTRLVVPDCLVVCCCITRLCVTRLKVTHSEIVSPSTRADLDLQELEGSGIMRLFPAMDLNLTDHEPLTSLNLDCLLDASFHHSSD